MNKLAASLLVPIMALAQLAFTDIGGHWAETYINYAVENGLMDGIADGLFDPDGDFVIDQAAATRAEFLRILSLEFDLRDMPRLNTVNSLPDITIDTPFFLEIVAFYEAGIVAGSTIDGVENSFAPFATLTRAQAAAIFMRIIDIERRVSGITYGQEISARLAGTGSSGFGDGVAELASFTLPSSLIVLPNGDIIVFDTFNNAIRIISGDAVTTMTGQWLGIDENRFSRGSFRDGALAEALFDRPAAGVINATGDLFVVDSQNHKIRKISGGEVATFVDEGILNTPMAIAIDGAGNLYITDTLNAVIRKIDTEGNISTIAGVLGQEGHLDGPAEQARFRQPAGIAVNFDGSAIYVADTGNHVIRHIENGIVSTLAGMTTEINEDGGPMGGFANGAHNEAMFNLPKGLALADDILFVADSGNNMIRAIAQGFVFTAAGTGEPGDRVGGILTTEFNQPAGIFWHDGVLYIADTTNNLIKTIIPNRGEIQ
ncbi:MAG: S-layer homology domain-containing protein [Clostridiales bacterium]|jgi:DNA-binding beta-propeller fold protein YncE|nr:S-layer homology domain-containing protein [Clostridiales bacterium]